MSDERDDDVRAAEADMDDTARDMEREAEAVGRDIDDSRRKLDELRAEQGGAAEDVTGEWGEDAGDERGDESGPGRWKAARE